MSVVLHIPSARKFRTIGASFIHLSSRKKCLVLRERQTIEKVLLDLNIASLDRWIDLWDQRGCTNAATLTDNAQMPFWKVSAVAVWYLL